MSWEEDFLVEKIDRITTALARLEAQLKALTDEVGRLRDTIEAPVQGALPFPADPFEQLVTLDQAAAVVHRSKRCLEDYKLRGMPVPRVKGRRGQPALYLWGEMRPWLTSTFGINLPDEFPGSAA